MSDTEYGWKEVARAKEWFTGNAIHVVTPFTDNAPHMPCITIVQMQSAEAVEYSSLADQGHETGDYDPKANALIPQYVYKPFTPQSYDPATGIVTFPDGITTEFIVPGQFYVSATGKAYQIYELAGPNSFKVKCQLNDDFTNGYVAPPTNLWNCKRERTRLNETFTLGLHAVSDPAHCIWMRQLVQYILLRYKEAYFDDRGFELSTFSTSEIDLNQNFKNADKVYSCFITLSGNVETTWLKYVAPKLMGVHVAVAILDGPKTPPAYLAEAEGQGWVMEADEEKLSGCGEDQNNSLEQGVGNIQGLGENSVENYGHEDGAQPLPPINPSPWSIVGAPPPPGYEHPGKPRKKK
jgi:hypothetical protein